MVHWRLENIKWRQWSHIMMMLLYAISLYCFMHFLLLCLIWRLNTLVILVNNIESMSIQHFVGFRKTVQKPERSPLLECSFSGSPCIGLIKLIR